MFTGQIPQGGLDIRKVFDVQVEVGWVLKMCPTPRCVQCQKFAPWDNRTPRGGVFSTFKKNQSHFSKTSFSAHRGVGDFGQNDNDNGFWLKKNLKKNPMPFRPFLADPPPPVGGSGDKNQSVTRTSQ